MPADGEGATSVGEGQFATSAGHRPRAVVLGAPSQLEQSNSSIIFGDQLVLKLYRRLGDGTNPDLEISRFLTEHGPFEHIAPLGGALEYDRPETSGRTAQRTEGRTDRRRGEPTTIGILQSYVPNEGDAWRLTLDAIRDYLERVSAYPVPVKPPSVSTKGLMDNSGSTLPPMAEDLIGPYLEVARQLGQRTAELHLALAADVSNPSFAPEPFSTLYQRSLYQSMRTQTDQSLLLLRQRLGALDPETRVDAQAVLDLEERVLDQFRTAIERPITALRIRCHGDYHLGQVLYTGKDCVIVDFEGEPARSITERRIKRTPLRDVAGMLRSFHYAACFVLAGPRGDGDSPRRTTTALSDQWVHFWYGWTAATFLRSYFDRVGDSSILPRTRTELEALLDTCLLEKAVYELGYELNSRPSWAHIPLRGIRELVTTGGQVDD